MLVFQRQHHIFAIPTDEQKHSTTVLHCPPPSDLQIHRFENFGRTSKAQRNWASSSASGPEVAQIWRFQDTTWNNNQLWITVGLPTKVVVEPTHLQNISKNGNLPQIRDDNKQYLKPPGSPLWYLWYSKNTTTLKKPQPKKMYRIEFKALSPRESIGCRIPCHSTVSKVKDCHRLQPKN